MTDLGEAGRIRVPHKSFTQILQRPLNIGAELAVSVGSMRDRFCVLLLAGALLFGVGCRPARAPVAVAAAEEIKETALDRAATAFFAGPIPTFDVRIASNALNSLRQEPRKPVLATVVVGSEVFESVSIHVKGSAGSSRSVDDNPALTLNFGKFKEGQNAFGLHKLHLNNSVQDPSRMDELVASTLYRKAGIPTARATQALVILNGRDLGLYVLKEGYDKAFVRRNFPTDPEAQGNLYDGGFVRDIDQDLVRDVGRGTNDYADLQKLRDAVNEPPATRLARLGAILDLDHFLTYCALQSIMDDWDGYPRNRNNYRLYHDPVSGRFHFIPHGMDQLFANVAQPLDPGWSGIVAQRYFELPGSREHLLDRIGSLSSNLFTVRVLTNILDPATVRLTNALAMRPDPERQELMQHINGLRWRLLERAAQIPQQLELRPRPITFDEHGEMRVGGWLPRPDTGNGVAEILTFPEGNRVFHLVARSPGTVAGFRAPMRLPAGDYQLSARIKTANLEPLVDERGVGAGLRIGGSRRTNSISGTHDWTTIHHELHLSEARDLEWVAEIRANGGEAWIEANSLRLTRLQR